MPWRPSPPRRPLRRSGRRVPPLLMEWGLPAARGLPRAAAHSPAGATSPTRLRLCADDYFFVADQEPLLPPLIVPAIELPFTLPAYLVPPTLNVISSPRSLPPLIAVEPSVPSTFWNVCFSVRAF